MFCKFCGSQIDDGSEFCPVCGKALTEAPAEAPAEAERAQAQAQAAPVQQEAPVQQAAGDKPTGAKKIFLLVGSIVSFIAILLMFGLYFGSGVQINTPFGSFSEGAFITVSEFLDFSESGIISTLNELSSMEATSSLISLIFSFCLVIVILITLFVYTIIGIVAFVKAMKGQDYERIGNTASHVFEIFTTGLLIFLVLHVETAEEMSIGLNGCALAGIILGALLVATNLVMHLLTRGIKGLFNLRSLLSVGFSVLLLVCGAIVAGLASGATYQTEGGAAGMFALFTSSIDYIGVTASPTTAEIYSQAISFSAFGFACAIVLVELGVKSIRTAMTNVQAIGDGKPEKVSGIAVPVTMVVFAVVSIVAHYLYANAFNATDMLNPALPIVIAIFSIVAIVANVLTKKFAKPETKE